MANENLRKIEGRSVLRMERQLRHPPEKVWRALTDPAELIHWFPASVQLEPRIGSRVEYQMDGEPGGDGQVLEFDPARVFAITWSGEVLRWELLPTDDGCLLVLTHTFDDHFGAASFASGWTLCLDALDQRLLGKPTDIAPDTGELHDRFLELLNLNQGTAEQTPDGWTIRFERQLTRPADTVRPLLASYQDPDVHYELTQGTGHGARLVLTQTGLPTPDKALATWRERLNALATNLLKTPPAE
ncbi:SRPBCC family protein [Kribbella yunnanensis]|uniref:SRPBCC family protein n=1 Tax=Kribbella yunnanensis TaxID=190194 RepID=A0ABP4UBE7_9ACTN